MSDYIDSVALDRLGIPPGGSQGMLLGTGRFGALRWSCYPRNQTTDKQLKMDGCRKAYQLTSPVQNQVDDLLADGVVTAGVVVGRVFLASDQLLRVEQLAVGTRADLICNWKILFSH